MDIKIEPPKLEGAAADKLIQLECWIKKLCMELNLNFDALELKIKKETEK